MIYCIDILQYVWYIIPVLFYLSCCNICMLWSEKRSRFILQRLWIWPLVTKPICPISLNNPWSMSNRLPMSVLFKLRFPSHGFSFHCPMVLYSFLWPVCYPPCSLLLHGATCRWAAYCVHTVSCGSCQQLFAQCNETVSKRMQPISDRTGCVCRVVMTSKENNALKQSQDLQTENLWSGFITCRLQAPSWRSFYRCVLHFLNDIGDFCFIPKRNSDRLSFDRSISIHAYSVWNASLEFIHQVWLPVFGSYIFLHLKANVKSKKYR